MPADLLLWTQVRTLSPDGFPSGDARRAEASARRLLAQRAAMAAVAARGQGVASSSTRPPRG